MFKHNRVLLWALVTVILALGLTLPAAARQEKPAAPAPAPQAKAQPIRPAPMSGYPETGVFKLFVMESEVGRIEYSLTADGRYERKFTLSMGGQQTENILKIEPDILGEWQSMEMVAPTDTVTVQREVDTARFVVKSTGEKYSVKLTPGHILDDNYGPVFYSFMLRAYDMQKKAFRSSPGTSSPRGSSKSTLSTRERNGARSRARTSSFCATPSTSSGSRSSFGPIPDFISPV
ncbi:MAG: hypothetical protein MUP19_03850 [Candidatus Aminicenantes bacterium]|nr:hypothetical protein [Candidatus Aminicenantes bacterium]